MTIPARTLVCGVGGITGDTVVSVLAERGFTVRALVHRDERRAAALSLGAESVAVADYDDDASLAAAMDGVDAVFFVAPSYQEAEPRWVAAALRAAEAAGVVRFVYQSVLHPFTPAMPHHARKAQAEVEVRASRLRWTILQPAMYAQTVLRVRGRSSEGRMNVPYDPDALFAVVDVRDVAACVAEVLLDDAHVYGGYEIVGAEIQSLRQMTATLNRLLGEDREVVQVEPDTLPLPPWWGERQRAEYALMCREYGAHGLLGSARTATALLGRTPTTFADVVVRDLRDSITPGVTV
ncbi:NmrA family NAD(P)-binding protein [Thermopolyspora sp. NPDC052614]|uniref:NmrA family NAD(P)-binding protein n=1 Tax=Thermopolyspora sp. NPDC052614 TaxID=3155682 RepID=UPI00343209B9